MRRHAHPPPVPEASLKPARRSVAGAVLLLALTLATGGVRSPLAPLLLAAVCLVIRFVPSPLALAAPVGAAGLLVLAEAVSGDVASHAYLWSAAFIVAAGPAWLWRRQVRRGEDAVREVAEIRAQVSRGDVAEEPAAVEELDDLQRALGAVAARLLASRVALWDVDALNGQVRVRITSAGRLRREARLGGDPLGWIWDQQIRMQIDPLPRWASGATLVIGDLLRRDDVGGQVVTFEWAGTHTPSPEALDEAVVYLRGVLRLQQATGHAAAADRRQRALVRGLQKIPGDLELEVLAAELCTTAAEITDGTGAAMGTWAGETGIVLAVSGNDGGPVPGDPFAPPAAELAFAARADTRIVRSSEEGWSLGATCLAHEGERWLRRPRSLAVLPLRGAGGISGVLAVWSSEARSLDPQGLDLLLALTPYAALHIEHARAFGHLRETAERDPLTQLRNRRAFDEAFAAERVRFDRYARPLSLLAMDLDHFKGINDRYGHEAGDEVLRNMARLINGSLRDVDIAARFGGEEFLALLPETGLTAALEAAERIRSAVADAVVDWKGQRIPLRVSIGVASAPETTAHPQELLSAADAALYEAKGRGRNRVVAAGR